MFKLLIVIIAASLVACNNSGNSKTEKDSTTTSAANNPAPTVPGDPSSRSSASIQYSVMDTMHYGTASVLVTKDEDKLSPGNDLFAMITANLPNEESIVVNFLFDKKPGTYPIVGLSFTWRNQVFGGLLGGKKAITPYKVVLTDVRDLGSNNAGGHRWLITGNVEGEVTIDAMGIMKMDKTHPDNIRIKDIRFANLVFDDNWDEMMEKATK